MSDSSKIVDKQPSSVPEPEIQSYEGAVAHTGTDQPRGNFGQRLKAQYLTKDGLLGDYNWGELCMPRLWPYRTKNSKPPSATPFYGLEDNLPVLLSAICGLQHALAMLAGLITPPIIIASEFGLPDSTQSYLISASLITCGILSAVQMSAIPLPIPFIGRCQIGTGVLSVVGTSFATLSTVTAIATSLYADGTCTSTTAADGTVTRDSCPDGYGAVLGTAAVCGLLEVFLSFLPPRVLRKMFPPLITGPVVFLIGASLVGSSGFSNWAGSADGCEAARGTTGLFSLCPTIYAPHALPWGSREFLGLGLFSFLTIVFVEIFGSPSMRSASIVIGLVFPTLVLGIPLHYTSRETIDSAPAITFLWVHTFKLRVYGPAVLPFLAVYCSLMSEAIGDITATSEVSRLEVQGLNFDRRLKGGILSDGLGGIFSALCTTTPLSVFAQNNGVISITRVANRKAGYWCCFFLILFGILGKISGAILAIPDPILGGVTTFLFTTVAVAGLSILAKVKYSRRNRFILGLSLSLGLGNLLIPTWASFFLPTTGNRALQGFYNSVQIIIETPFLICAITGIIANAILPYDAEDMEDLRLEKLADEEDRSPLSDSEREDPSFKEK